MTSKIRNFQIQNRLGSGSYGVIFKAINKNDKQLCVMKQIRMNKMSDKNKKSTLMQATIMGKLNHPFIVQYKDSFIETDTLHIVMQYCDNGDLSMFLKMQNKKPLKQDKIWRFFIQICMGLEYIHRNKILHRDIKTLNIFLNKNQDVKIGDLGVAKMLMSNDFAQTIVGTPYYLSPQLCEEKPYNQKSDIWAMGCLLYELCTYKHPFEAANQASLILKIIRGKYSAIPQFYSKQLKDMIDLCLERDYKRRPTANMILSRPKIKQYIKEFNLEEKVNQFYQKLKLNQQNKKPPINQFKKVENKKDILQKAVQQISTSNLGRKDEVNEVKQKSPNFIKNVDQDKKNKNIQQKKPTISGMPQKNIILPDKNRIIEKLNPDNIDKNRHPNLIKPQQNDKKVKQNKLEFLKNLQNAIDQPVKKKNYSKQKQKNKNEQIGSAISQHKSRLQKIDIKIQEELKRQKEIQKDKKSNINEKKKQQFQQMLASPQRIQKNPLLAERKSVPVMIKQIDRQNKDVIMKPYDIPMMPPLPPKNKEQVIKVKMDQPPIAPKVYDSNNSKSKGVIKSKGFSQEIVQSNQKKLNSPQINKNQSQRKPILFGLDEQQKERQSIHFQKNPSKQISENGLKNSQYHSEKNIKVVSETRAVHNNSVFGQKKQSEHYLFKKNSQNYSNSRIRKGSGCQPNQNLSRNAKNVSKYKQVSKQQEDLVMNLPDRPGNIYEDTSSDEELKQPSQINMNKKFQLKDVNNSIVLQKYQEILSSQSMESTGGEGQSKVQSKTKPFKKSQNQFVKVNKNLNQYDEENKYQPQQRIEDEQINRLFVNSKQNQQDQQNNKNQEQQIMQNQSLIQKTQQLKQNEEEIQDESQEMIDCESEKGDQIHEEIYEINKFNLQQKQDSTQQNNHQEQNFQNDYKTERTQQWSFDEQPQLPMLQQKQSPYFEQANPYLVPAQQEQTLQEKKNYLQIRLQENMKREDEINKLMQIKIEECKAIVPKHFEEIIEFFRKKINMDDQYTENDEKQVEEFLRKKGLTDQRKFQNIYKIMHFEMELENTRTIIQRICKKLNQLEQHHNS